MIFLSARGDVVFAKERSCAKVMEEDASMRDKFLVGYFSEKNSGYMLPSFFASVDVSYRKLVASVWFICEQSNGLDDRTNGIMPKEGWKSVRSTLQRDGVVVRRSWRTF